MRNECSRAFFVAERALTTTAHQGTGPRPAAALRPTCDPRNAPRGLAQARPSSRDMALDLLFGSERWVVWRRTDSHCSLLGSTMAVAVRLALDSPERCHSS
jgi:hypothetical protein